MPAKKSAAEECCAKCEKDVAALRKEIAALKKELAKKCQSTLKISLKFCFVLMTSSASGADGAINQNKA